MQDLFIEFLPPWVETGLQPAFYDRESGTVLQQTARMYAKVNELVKAVNGMDKIIKEYVDYIDNYFKNLDVQEEINNKLDEMAEDGTLDEIINQNIFNELDDKIDGIGDRVTDLEDIEESEEAKLAPFTYNYIYSAIEGCGNSLFIEGDKNIIVDFCSNSGIVDPYLRSKNITKIDAIVITHYHDDHTGGLSAQGLIEVLEDTNIDFTGCIAYLPHKGIDWTQVTGSDTSTIMQTEVAVKSALSSAGISYIEPDNEEVATLSTLTKMQFFNIGSQFYNHYYGYNVWGESKPETDYNHFSMLVKITHNNSSEFETGDATFLTQKYNAQYLTDIDIYHACHHGRGTSQSKNWETKLYAKYCVVTMNTSNSAIQADGSDVLTCGMRGAKIYNVRDAGNTISIVQKGDELSCDSSICSFKNDLAIGSRPLVFLDLGTDLDDVIDDGCYYCVSGVQAGTMSNLPPCDGDPSTNHSFRLDVIKTIVNGETDSGIKQILTFNNTNEERSGYWYREKRTYNTGFGKWWYVEPSFTEGTSTLYDTFVFGGVSGDGKEISLAMPLRRYIPEFAITNPALLGVTIKKSDGNLIYAYTSEALEDYTVRVDRSNNGLKIRIKKADDTSFGVTNISVTGWMDIQFDLETPSA